MRRAGPRPARPGAGASPAAARVERRALVSAAMVTVCALIPPAERSRIEAVGSGCFVTLYAASFREVLAAARRARVDAVVFSAHSCAADDLPSVMRLVREFPALPTVALVSRHDAVSTQTLLRLGASGVRAAIDCSMFMSAKGLASE